MVTLHIQIEHTDEGMLVTFSKDGSSENFVEACGAVVVAHYLAEGIEADYDEHIDGLYTKVTAFCKQLQREMLGLLHKNRTESK